MTSPDAPTPRAVRHRLNRLESWFRKNRHALTVQRQEAAERLFDLAVTAGHADALEEALRSWEAEAVRIAERITELAEEGAHV